MDEEIKETPEQESSETTGTEPSLADVGETTGTEPVSEGEEII